MQNYPFRPLNLSKCHNCGILGIFLKLEIGHCDLGLEQMNKTPTFGAGDDEKLEK